ncbi:MAG TPA: energy transducer TonB [Terriglobales bacterium]|nr:energy transducer TonB [Terriglobales bacterium]
MSLRTIFLNVTKALVFSAALTLLFSTVGTQTTSAQESLERKVKSRVSPIYPEIARKMNLAGVVKLEVTVTPSGTVKDTKVIGGNPILVNAAADAVKKWRFEPANDESVGVVEFKFDPTTN